MKHLPILATSAFAMALIAPASANPQIRWRNVSEAAPGKFEISAKFPEFRGDAVAQLASREIRALMMGEVRSFDRSGPPAGSAIPNYSLDMRTTVSVARPGLVSVLVETYVFTGGAHPNTFLRAMSWGMVDGKAKRLNLRDMLRPGVSPHDVAARKVVPALNGIKQKRGADPFTELLPPTLINNVLIRPAGLTWLFSPYDVGAYAEGSYRVALPWGELTDAVDPNGPLFPIMRGEGEMIDTGRVTLVGTVGYRERILLPADSPVLFTLFDRAGRVLATEERKLGAVPMEFRVVFPTRGFSAERPAAMRVQILVGGRVRFETAEPVEVTVYGWEAPRELMLVGVR